MKFKDIPVEVEQFAVRCIEGAGCVQIKVALALFGDGPGLGEVRQFFIDEVLPRPEIGQPVSLEGLDLIPAEDRTPDQTIRLDRLAWRRSQAIKISCAAPKAWWEHVRIKLWGVPPEERDDATRPVVGLYPASADGKIQVVVRDDSMSATVTWTCKAELAEVGEIAEVAKLTEETTGTNAWLDVAFEGPQLELFDEPSREERTFARAAAERGVKAPPKSELQ